MKTAEQYIFESDGQYDTWFALIKQVQIDVINECANVATVKVEYPEEDGCRDFMNPCHVVDKQSILNLINQLS